MNLKIRTCACFSVRAVGLSVVLMAAGSTLADATQRNWSGVTTGGVPPAATPLEWNSSDNWEGGNVPSLKTDLPAFSITGTLFVNLPSDLTFGALSAKRASGSGNVYLVGERVLVDDSGWTGSQGAVKLAPGRITDSAVIYADVTAKKNISGVWTIAGDLIVNGELTSSAGMQYWHGDYYANSASETRANAFDIKTVNNSSSSVYFYGPRATTARDSADWSQVEGSAFVTYTGTSIGTIAPGCGVSGSGIPSGTFLKRYFPGLKVIELSQPVTSTLASNTLHFDAYTPVTTGRIRTLSLMNDGTQLDFKASRQSAASSFTINVDEMKGNYYTDKDSRCRFQLDITQPAQLVIGRTDRLYCNMQFWSSQDLVFPQPTSGVAGIAKAHSISFKTDKDRPSCSHRVTVETGVDAIYSNITEVASATTFTKAGAGSLLLDFNEALATVGGSFVAEAGTLELKPRAAATFAKVSVTNGATLKLASGTAVIACAEPGATLEAAAGATIDLTAYDTLPTGLRLEGAGTFLIKSLAAIGGAVRGADMAFQLAQEGNVNDFHVTGDIVPMVVGTPAFWLDPEKNVETYPLTNGVANGYVSCWRDCRVTAGSDAFRDIYATNDFTGLRQTTIGTCPSKLVTYGSRTYVRHLGEIAFRNPGQTETNPRWIYSGMTWNRPITNIRAVFSVTYQDNSESYGGAVLGATPRFPEAGLRVAGCAPFGRGVDNTTDGGGIASPANAFLYSAKAADCVKNGKIYAEGYRRNWNDKEFRANDVEIRDTHTLAPGAPADAFAIQDDGSWANPVTKSGCLIQGETIIYTNELTTAEREQVRAYLIKKYRGQNYSVAASVSRYDGEDGHVASFTVAADDQVALAIDDVVVADRLTGSGTFVKKGTGTFYADLVDGTSLTVDGGEMVVHSAVTPTTYAELPGNHGLHWDAANTNNMKFVNRNDTFTDGLEPASRQVKEVQKWYDARYGNDGVHIYGTSRKSDERYRAGWLVENGLNGLPVVDYGPLLTYKDEKTHNMTRRVFHEFHLTDANTAIELTPICSLFVVKNAEAGGNWVLGHNASTDGKGIRRATNTTDYTKPILSSGGVSASLNDEEVNPTKVGYTGGWDQLALYSSVRCNGSCLGGAASNNPGGGMKVGELIVYTNTLCWADARKVNAYLGKKWFNRTMPYATPARAGKVVVSSGATLTVEGGAPLEATSISGAGTVAGAVKLTAGATLEVYVEEDGTVVVPTSTVTGALDLSAGGTIVLTGSVDKAQPGRYTLISAASVASGAWTCSSAATERICKAKVTATSLYLDITKAGLSIIFR